MTFTFIHISIAFALGIVIGALIMHRPQKSDSTPDNDDT